MTISRDDVLRVAELAHLELTPDEAEMYRGQLDEILNYVGKLQQLDLTNVEPMTQMSFATGETTSPSPRVEPRGRNPATGRHRAPLHRR
jgi:aspartyl/glutamyl-tRNA(Asn/Gln) amidotransferase C subunit